MNTRGSWALCIFVILAALPLTFGSTVRGQSVLAANPYTIWSDYGC